MFIDLIANTKRILPGLILAVAVAAIAIALAGVSPVGAVSLAIGIGVLIQIPVLYLKFFDDGIRFCENQVLAVAIALLGANVDFRVLSDLGLKALILVVASILLTILLATGIGRILGLSRKTSMLIGIGNGICGSAAIAATKDIVDADEDEVGLSITIINFLGTVGIFGLPFLCHDLFGFSDDNSGLLIGNTLQAVGQVVAAGFSMNEAAGQAAITVKLVRVVMLPIVAIPFIVLLSRNDEQTSKSKPVSKLVPPFIYGFLLFSLIPTLGLLSRQHIDTLSTISWFSLVVAMASIGLRIKIQSILKAGLTAFLVGLIVFVFQISISGIVIYLVMPSQ